MKLPISAIVVSMNEGYLLKDCLKSIHFCDEIIVVDLESTDETKTIAQKYASKILSHRGVPIVESVHKNVIPQTKNKWVLLTDPDERIDASLSENIFQVFKNINGNIGQIRVPIQYYFKGIKLNGTIWGGEDKKGRLLFNKDCIELKNTVHSGISLKKGCTTLEIQRTSNNVIHHFWIQDYNQLFEKHKRYIKEEGKLKFEIGQRFSYKRQIIDALRSFKGCFWNSKGYKDGLTGLFLSFFWAWYNFASWSSLKNYQKTQLLLDQT